MPSTAVAAAVAPPPSSPAKAAEAVEDPSQVEPFAPPEATKPIQLLPEDALQNVLGRLPLREALACRPACRAFRDALSSPPLLASLQPLRLLALQHPRAASSPHPSLHALDPSCRRWLRIPLSFLPFPYNQLLNSVTSLVALKRLHGFLLVRGLCHHLPLATKLLSLCALHSPTIYYARKLFDAAPQRDSFMWNTLLRAYADLGPCNEVPALYREMHRHGLSPDHFTFPFVVRACAVASALWEGKEVHCNVIKHGLGSNVFLQTALVTMYAQNYQVADAESVFGEMTFRNVVSWTSMIAGYAQNSFFAKATVVFRRMVGSGSRPNEVTLASVLPALTGLHSLAQGMVIHGFVIKSGMESYTSLGNALIAMYAKCGSINISQSLFEEDEARNLSSWNTMIAMYEQNGEEGKAIKLFRRMLAEKIGFNSITLVSVISACASSGALETGKWVHELARKEGLEEDLRIGNALVDLYGRCGSLQCARNAFDKLSWKGVVSWSAMIRAYAAHGNAKEALELFAQMQSEGIKPNAFTYTSILAACSHSGLLEEGMRHFDSMKDCGIRPTVEHYACMVDLHGRAGKLVDAYELIKRMSVEPDMAVWGALLGACRIHGNLEFAESVACELSQSGCGDGTFLLLMANMYAESGRWEDALRMRTMMKDLELKKTRGCSLVSTDRDDDRYSSF